MEDENAEESSPPSPLEGSVASAPPENTKDDTLDGRFEPGFASSPIESRSNITYVDEIISKIHVMPNKPVNVNASFLHQNQEEFKNYASSLPPVEERAVAFDPILYTFRIPTKESANTMANVNILCPPFYLLLDHAIGVLWTCFSPKTSKKIGISQLQWTVGFLRSLRNRNEELPIDIQLAVDTMEDAMIEQYADMGDWLDEMVKSKGVERRPSKKSMTTSMPFSVNYFDLITKTSSKKESILEGGPLVDTDDKFKEEVEDLHRVAGTLSVDHLMVSQSREDAINFLNAAQERHKNVIEMEIRRLRSVENILQNIASPKEFVGFTDLSKFANDISVDIEKSHEPGAFNASNVSSEPDSFGTSK